LPISPMVLGYLGDATVELGDPAGLQQMEQAIALMLEPLQSGALPGSSATIAGLGNNLALARLPIDGPARALEDFERAAAICETRGLREVAGIVNNGKAAVLFELGQPDAAIALAQAAAAFGKHAHDVWLDMTGTAQAVRYHAQRSGALPADFDLDAFSGGLRIGVIADAAPDVFATAVVANRLRGSGETAARLLAELEAMPGARASVQYPRILPLLVREALALGDVALAERLCAGLTRLHRLHGLALDAAAAAFLEAQGDCAAAAPAYGAASEAWLGYGNLPEHAYALHGRARSLRRAGLPDAEIESAAAAAFGAIGFRVPAELDGSDKHVAGASSATGVAELP